MIELCGRKIYEIEEIFINLETAKQYSLEQISKDHLYYGANEAFHTMLAYIAFKEGDENQAREYFEKQ